MVIVKYNHDNSTNIAIIILYLYSYSRYTGKFTTALYIMNKTTVIEITVHYNNMRTIK